MVADNCYLDTTLHFIWVCGLYVTHLQVYSELLSGRFQFKQEEHGVQSQIELYWNVMPPVNWVILGRQLSELHLLIYKRGIFISTHNNIVRIRDNVYRMSLLSVVAHSKTTVLLGALTVLCNLYLCHFILKTTPLKRTAPTTHPVNEESCNICCS